MRSSSTKCTPTYKPALSLHPVAVKLGVWQQIGIDLIGPLPETPSGNKYIMTVTDYFSKWPEAKAIPTKEARHVAEFLYARYQTLPMQDCTQSTAEEQNGQN